jgi:hypothetical protein
MFRLQEELNEYDATVERLKAEVAQNASTTAPALFPTSCQ